METACGIDSLMVVCSYTEQDKDCFYPSGPCEAGRQKTLAETDAVMMCGGSSALGAHLPSEKSTRLFYKDINAALSVAVEAICKMTTPDLDDHNARFKLFLDTLANIRSHVGEDHRLTSMSITCAWCKRPMGTKEGNGSVGDTSTICPNCFQMQQPGVTYDVQVVPLTAEQEQRVKSTLTATEQAELDEYRDRAAIKELSEGFKELGKRDQHAIIYAGLTA